MTKMDIDRLSEAELVDLLHRIVERLRFLEQMRAHAQMLDFSIGDRVCIELGSQGLIEGILTRYTPTMRTSSGSPTSTPMARPGSRQTGHRLAHRGPEPWVCIGFTNKTIASPISTNRRLGTRFELAQKAPHAPDETLVRPQHFLPHPGVLRTQS